MTREFAVDDRIQVRPCINIPAFKYVAVRAMDGDSLLTIPAKGDVIVDADGTRWELAAQLQKSAPPDPPEWRAHLQLEGGEEWYPGFPVKTPV